MERETTFGSAIEGARVPTATEQITSIWSDSQPAEIDLGQLMFSAKIDYVTLEMQGKVPLPELQGKPRWATSLHYKKLTIHDPQPQDLLSMYLEFGDLQVSELEVALDIRARPGKSADDALQLLKDVMVELYSLGLDPRKGKAMTTQFRAVYRRIGNRGVVMPFNMRRPLSTDQQLHGGRTDDAQVKAYLKGHDQGLTLKPKDRVARLEVRLSGAGLFAQSIQTICDLFGLKFRKALMPYFTHISGTKRSERLGKLPLLHRLQLNKFKDGEDRKLWEKSGVGAFMEGGKGNPSGLRLIRDSRVNDRIGQALKRLEKAFGRVNPGV